MKKKKYLEINLTKELIDLYAESYKTLLREIKHDLNERRENSCFLFRGSHCKNGNSTQINLQINSDPYQMKLQIPAE